MPSCATHVMETTSEQLKKYTYIFVGSVASEFVLYERALEKFTAVGSHGFL